MNLNKKDLIKKLKDPKFYLENYTKIKTKNQGILEPFKLNEAQKDLFNVLNHNNRVIINKVRQLGFCLDPSTRILTNDLRWIKLSDIKIGQRIVSVEEFPKKRTRRKMRTAIVEKKSIIFGEAFKLKMDNGLELIATAQHRFLNKERGAVHTVWRTVHNTKIGDEIRCIATPWDDGNFEDGWFGGMIDGEGSIHYKNHTGAEITISQRSDLPLWNRMKEYMINRGYNFNTSIDGRRGGDRNVSKFGKNPVGKVELARMHELFRLIGQTRPKRFTGIEWWNGKAFPGSGIGWSKVVSIESLGEREMIDLQTSEKTYIAEGFVSHNSTGIVGWMYHNTITTPGTNTAIIGYNSDLTAELLDKVKTFYRTTPDELKPTIQYNTKYEISFPAINSKIIVLPSTENVGVGYTLHNCHCLSGETIVYKRNGIPCKISELNEGDEILNGVGSYSGIKGIISRKNKEKLVKLSVYGCDPILVTKDHQLFVRKKGDGGEWKNAEDITEKDYIAYPYFQNRNKIKEIKLKDSITEKYESRSFKLEKVKLTREFGELCGWYIAEGSFNDNQVMLSVHKKEVRNILNLLKKNFLEYFSSWNVGYSKDSNTATVHLYGKPLCSWLAETFGKGCQNKKIDDRIWRWGWDFSYGLLRGIILGDGCLKNKRRTIIVTTSPSLVYQLKRLLVSIRICLPSISHRESFRYNKKGFDRYEVHIGGKGNYKLRRKLNFELPIYENGRAKYRTKNFPGTNQGGGNWKRGKFNYWGKVRKTELSIVEPLVYDIVLEKSPHSFVANGMVVHNCTELSRWEKAEEKMVTLEASVPPNGRLIIETCVTGETIVFTSDGPVRVKDVHDWDNFPLGSSNGKKIMIDGHYGLKPTNSYYNSGIRKGFRVFTRRGNSVGMSSIHKMFVLDGCSLKFKKSRDLVVGDKLAIKYGQELWGKEDSVAWLPSPYGFNKKWIKQFCIKKINPDISYLLGLILGDGYIDFKNGRVTITTIDHEVSNFLLNNSLGLKFIQSTGEDKYHYTCKNLSFVDFLSNFIKFSHCRAREKKIPDIVFRWSRKNVVAFLQGLFDTDGCCRKDRNRISLCSTSKHIIDTVRILLLNFGILSRTYSYNSKPSKKVKAWSSGYQLELDRNFSNIFLEKIGFRIKRKQLNGKKIHDSYGCISTIIPGLGAIIKKNLKNIGLKNEDIKRKNKSFYSKSGNISYRTLGMLLSKCRNKESKEYKELKNLFDLKYEYDEIVKIVPIEENVYDFTVDDGSTVVYNGVVGHQTPHGAGNLYHRMWMAEDNGYIKREYGWWWGYTKEQMDLVAKRMNDPAKFAENFGLAFLTSGRSVFEASLIIKLRESVWKVGQEVPGEKDTKHFVKVEDNLRIFHDPVPGEQYVCGADVSEGVNGGDYSTAKIFRRSNGEEVASFRGLIAPDRFGDKLNIWGRKYNNALMAVEVNNHGLTTITVLKKLIYPSLYMRPAKFETAGMSFSEKIGWKTTKVTRLLLIDEFAQACRIGELTIHSKELVDEMSVFVYNDNGEMQPQSRMFHDDEIFAAAIAFQAFKIMYSGKLEQVDYKKYLPKTYSY